MSGASKIEWTDATWNPVTGCVKVSSGCKNCYAERLWPRTEGARIKREGGAARPFTDVRVHHDRLDAPLRWRAAAPFVGIAGQPFWLWATWDAGQWGMLGLSIAYTLAWGRGVVGVLRDRAAVRVAAEIRRNRDGRG